MIQSKLYFEVNALTDVGPLMTLTHFTLPNARRFYSSVENQMGLKGLKISRWTPRQFPDNLGCSCMGINCLVMFQKQFSFL